MTERNVAASFFFLVSVSAAKHLLAASPEISRQSSGVGGSVSPPSSGVEGLMCFSSGGLLVRLRLGCRLNHLFVILQ